MREVILEQDFLHCDDHAVLQEIHVFCASTFGRDGEHTKPYEGTWMHYEMNIRDLSRSHREKLWEYCETHQIEVADA